LFDSFCKYAPACKVDQWPYKNAMTNKPDLIYHMAHRSDWDSAIASGNYTGSPDDLRDGFIHFSTGRQIRGSASKHRAGQEDLLLICYRIADLSSQLKWEGQDILFPHIYGELNPAKAWSVQPLPLGGDGLHVFPEEVD
jgi:uncharacterized protein (DUF952 family)